MPKHSPHHRHPRREPSKADANLPVPGTAGANQLVTIESQREYDLFTGRWSQRLFVKMYVEARSSGLLAAISDRDWKTLCTLATYMDSEGFCFPSQAELAKAMGCSRQMANERVKSLANFLFRGQAVLVVVKGERTQGRWSRNGYRVLPIASLGIFDGKTSKSLNNSGEAAMSSELDTVHDQPTVSTSMSSATGTVQLDTNYNHTTNKIEQETSNSRNESIKQSENCRRTGQTSDAPAKTSGFEKLEGVLSRTRVGSPPREYDEARQAILGYITDIGREFGDHASLKSSTTRAHNLYTRSGISIDAFLARLFEARALTRERVATSHNSSSGRQQRSLPTRNRMAYFFACLQERLGLPKPATPAADHHPRTSARTPITNHQPAAS
ncbi:MAG: helix-turn-helix domain-containing protein [Chloroflexota bacterium]|nr:MAG: helix-turn-helix domain-containing protein [Chloroflexota bacterium]